MAEAPRPYDAGDAWAESAADELAVTLDLHVKFDSHERLVTALRESYRQGYAAALTGTARDLRAAPTGTPTGRALAASIADQLDARAEEALGG